MRIRMCLQAKRLLWKLSMTRDVPWKSMDGLWRSAAVSCINTTVYKQNAENGVMSPSDVFSNSDEALVLVNVQWRSKAKHLRMARRKLSQAEKDNLPKQKYMNFGNKLKGWKQWSRTELLQWTNGWGGGGPRKQWQQEVRKGIPVGSQQQHSADKGKGRGRLQCKR